MYNIKRTCAPPGLQTLALFIKNKFTDLVLVPLDVEFSDVYRGLGLF